MCLCGFERLNFRNGTAKSSINTGRYTVDYLLCGDLPYPAWKKRVSAQDLRNRRIRRYFVCRLKRSEARDFSHVRFTKKNLRSISLSSYLTTDFLEDVSYSFYEIPDQYVPAYINLETALRICGPAMIAMMIFAVSPGRYGITPTPRAATKLIPSCPASHAVPKI